VGLALITISEASGVASAETELQHHPDRALVLLHVPQAHAGGQLRELLTLAERHHRVCILVREISPHFWESTLALLAPKDHVLIQKGITVLRESVSIAPSYTELLWERNQVAIRTAGADRRAMFDHPRGGVLFQEIDRLQKLVDAKVNLSFEQLASLENQLRELRERSFKYRAKKMLMPWVDWFYPPGSWRRRRLKYFLQGCKALLRGPVSYLRWLRS
jgi:hypothetical protein